jgi:hypothetical protein
MRQTRTSDPSDNADTRPIGLGWRPPWAPAPYDPARIPADAIAPVTQDLAPALLEARRVRKAVVISTDMTCSRLGFENVAIYGRPIVRDGAPPRLPMIRYTGPALTFETEAFMYSVDGDLAFYGVGFAGFGLVAAVSVPSLNIAKPFPFQSWATGFRRAVPRHQGGVALHVSQDFVDARIGAKGPTVTVQKCHFLNCHQVFMAVSDTAYVTLNAHDNDVEGTFGGFDLNTTVGSDIWGSQNEWHGCIGDRMQPDTNSHGLGTFWKIGVENTVHKLIRKQAILLANNYYHDVDSLCKHNDTNTSVAFDGRNINPAHFDRVTPGDLRSARTADCSFIMEYERYERLTSSRGREDCNAVYGKVMGGIWRHSIVNACGAPNQTANGFEDGSEFACGFKNPGYWDALDENAFFVCHDITFIDLPRRTAASQIGMFGLKIDGYAMPTYMTDISFVRWRDTANKDGGAIRNFGAFEHGLWIDGTRAINCAFGAGAPLINLHKFSGKAFVTNSRAWNCNGPVLVVADGKGAQLEQAGIMAGAPPPYHR